MAQDLICRPIFPMTFRGRESELLKIYSTMAGRVGNIENISLNNFKILKTTFNPWIYEFICFFVDFTILNNLIKYLKYFQLFLP